MDKREIDLLKNLNFTIEDRLFYIDINRFVKLVSINTYTDDGKIVEMNMPKFDIIKTMMDSIFSEYKMAEEPGSLAHLTKENDGFSIPFKIAFITLLKYKIIKEVKI